MKKVFTEWILYKETSEDHNNMVFPRFLTDILARNKIVISYICVSCNDSNVINPYR